MSSLQRVFAILLLSGQLSACTGWRLETMSPADVISAQHPSLVRVERNDGRREVLYRPAVKGDSVVGLQAADNSRSNRAVSLTDIREVATLHVRPVRTTALVLGMGLIAAIAAFAASGPLGLGN